jgi:hypothetical protein
MYRSRFLGLAAAGAFAGSWPHPFASTTLAKAYRFLDDMMDRYAPGGDDAPR